MLVELSTDDAEYQSVHEEMISTIREHRDGGVAGGVFKTYSIIKVDTYLCLLLTPLFV